MEFIISIMRYIAPVTAIIVIGISVKSLFRNRPRVHKLARLVEINGATAVDINHWETSIGKSKSNDIVLPYPSVARFHAVIAKKRRDWIVADTSGKTATLAVNGTLVDGKAVIENGDIIQIGDTQMKFECNEALSKAEKQQMRNVAAAPAGVAYGVLVNTVSKRPVYLKKQDIVIGRSPECDIQLTNQTVSSIHARIYQTSRGWAVADLDSHNGTKLNGRYITQPQLIFDEDLLTFGDVVFVFYDK